MVTLSLAMIVRDEERFLARALAGILPAIDQLVVVDTGSRDRTVEVALAHGAEVHHFPWRDDFAAARNHAFGRARGDWVMWLDADDVVPPAALTAILALKAGPLSDDHLDAVLSPSHLSYHPDGQVMEKCDRERFVRRAARPTWHDPVHETIDLAGMRLGRCPEAVVEHRPDAARAAAKVGRYLAIYRARVDPETASPHCLFQYACELQWNHLPAEAAAMFGRFLGRAHGLPDDTGDQYLAELKRADCLAQTGRGEAAVEGCLRAVRLDPQRAEAPCLAGELLLQQAQPERALPLLVAATLQQVPTASPKLVLPWFYGERPRRRLAHCLEGLPAPHEDGAGQAMLRALATQLAAARP